MTTKYSNPRTATTINDWPYGKFRTTAAFLVECNKRGERVSRTTINPKNGRINKPKLTTYSLKARIVDGSDERTYIAELTEFDMIYIRSSDMIHQHEVIHSDNSRYAELLNLFEV